MASVLLGQITENPDGVNMRSAAENNPLSWSIVSDDPVAFQTVRAFQMNGEESVAASNRELIPLTVDDAEVMRVNLLEQEIRPNESARLLIGRRRGFHKPSPILPMKTH